MTAHDRRSVPWQDGSWTHAPADVESIGTELHVTAARGSDAWRLTSYGFVHDTEHALVTPFDPGRAVEVSFVADFAEQFDQAGVFLRVDAEHWVKAGVEYADGALQVGAVVTEGRSDWSVAPVPAWHGRTVTVRASWADDALTVRARCGQDPSQLVRVLPFPGDRLVSAGPYVCAPTRAGLTVTLRSWETTAADVGLH